MLIGGERRGAEPPMEAWNAFRSTQQVENKEDHAKRHGTVPSTACPTTLFLPRPARSKAASTHLSDLALGGFVLRACRDEVLLQILRILLRHLRGGFLEHPCSKQTHQSGVSGAQEQNTGCLGLNLSLNRFSYPFS